MARKHWKKTSKDAKPGESCYSAVKWAMLHGTLVFHKLCPLISASSVILRMMWRFFDEMPWLVHFFETCSQGIVEHPHWYPGLTKRSTFREFQAWKRPGFGGSFFSWPIFYWFRVVFKVALRQRLKSYLF